MLKLQNIKSKHILKESTEKGKMTYKRIIADFTNSIDGN